MKTQFLLIIRIILFIIGIIIAVDCLYLMALKKFNFGTIVPLLLGTIFITHAICWKSIQQLINRHLPLKYLWLTAWLGFFLWLMSFIAFVITIQQQINSQSLDNPVKAIIVLGAGVNGDKPSPALANRLNTASIVWHKQYDKFQSQAWVVTAGGIGFNRKYSEAWVMANYLSNKKHYAIDNTYILKEEHSTSTEENFALSKPLLANKGIDITKDSIAVVTNDFHIVRAKAIAIKQGYHNTLTIASPTPTHIKANAWFREYFAYVSGWLLNEY